MTPAHILTGFAVGVCAFCAILFWALAAGGRAVDEMRRDESDNWVDQNAEWDGYIPGPVIEGVRLMGHLHSTHNPSRQDGEGETGFRIDHHVAAITAISEV